VAPSRPAHPEIKVKRGLGILEDLLKEKHPSFFIEQAAKRAAAEPKGIPVAAVMSRLKPQVRSFNQMNSQDLGSAEAVNQSLKPS
jgi:hypothetical protein